MSATVYSMKTVNGCKNVAIMSVQDEQCRRTSLLCLNNVIFLLYYKRMQSKHKKTKHYILRITAFSYSRYH